MGETAAKCECEIFTDTFCGSLLCYQEKENDRKKTGSARRGKKGL